MRFDVYAALTSPFPQVNVVVALLRVELGGLAPTASAARPDGWYAADEGLRLTVVQVAPAIPTDRGRPVRSVTKWIFDPYLPLSTGFGPVGSPLPSSRP